MDDIDEVAEYLENALDGFKRDPADSDYQRGYEAALVEMSEYLRDRGVLP